MSDELDALRQAVLTGDYAEALALIDEMDEISRDDKINKKVATFYKDVFGMTEVGRGGSTHIYLSDGDLNLTIRACKKHDDPDAGTHGMRV